MMWRNFLGMGSRARGSSKRWNFLLSYVGFSLAGLSALDDQIRAAEGFYGEVVRARQREGPNG